MKKKGLVLVFLPNMEKEREQSTAPPPPPHHPPPIYGTTEPVPVPPPPKKKVRRLLSKEKEMLMTPPPPPGRCVTPRETREGCPMLTVETEVNGDTNTVVHMKEVLPWLVRWTLVSLVQHTFFVDEI